MQRPRHPLTDDRFELPSDILEPTEFPPEIDPIVAEADPSDYFRWLRYLSGAEPVQIGGSPFRFMRGTRTSGTATKRRSTCTSASST
jgi:hypothetical protein